MAEAVLFDLDGTLLDTAPDLAFALNAVRGEEGLPPLPFPAIRPIVSHGARALIQKGFSLSPADPAFEPLRQRLIAIYRAHIARKTRPFPGMEALLDILEKRNLPWGVVTNKPASLTEPLLKALGLSERAACILSGDSLPQKKPHPAPLLHAAALLGLPPEECLYVGDAERDIEAGRKAGMKALVALYGYIQGDPQTWGAEGFIRHPLEVLDWL